MPLRYHVALTAVREHVLAEGLLARNPASNPLWEPMFRSEPELHMPIGVYLWHSLDDAVLWAEKVSFQGACDIWAVDVERVEADPSELDAVYSPSTIAAERLRLLTA